ncbi:RDD family protein [Hamadaea sp. NPDC051192]|uniref:RDD family protein n=1 Tax=Hamadaea sp. NPDC051192 TaxID=3154940 RepID=UPI003425AF9B
MEHRAYAGLVSRLAGLGLDVLITAITVVVVGRGLPEVWRLVAGTPPHWVLTAFDWGANITPAVYFAGSWRLTGQTIGASVFGTVVRLADGSPIGLIRSILRAAIGLLFAPIWFVGTVTVLFDVRRRSLLDMAFGTVVQYLGRPGRPTP